MTMKTLTFELTLSGGNCYEKTFVASSVAIAWVKVARYVFCHAMQRVVGIRLIRQRRIVATPANHKNLPSAAQSSLFLLTN
jgi:hypothetical protein